MFATHRKNNVQVYPSKTIYFPNDRFAKKLASLTGDDFNEMNSGEERNLVELQHHKKFGKITSPFRIYVDEHASFTLSEPVEQFDFDVLCVGISEYRSINRCITPSIIYRGLTGKVGDSDANPSKDQLAAIMHSIEKLMFLKIKINMTDYCEKLNCNEGNAFEIVAPLLPCEYVAATINGKKTTVIHLLGESPIWQVACIKNQILSFDSKLLNVPGQQNTKMNIELKNYVLRRIVEIKAHRQLTPTITFDDLFFKCRLEDVSRQKKADARETVDTFFEHLQKEKFIKSFELIKQGNSFHSVKFTYSK